MDARVDNYTSTAEVYNIENSDAYIPDRGWTHLWDFNGFSCFGTRRGPITKVTKQDVVTSDIGDWVSETVPDRKEVIELYIREHTDEVYSHCPYEKWKLRREGHDLLVDDFIYEFSDVGYHLAESENQKSMYIFVAKGIDEVRIVSKDVFEENVMDNAWKPVVELSNFC